MIRTSDGPKVGIGLHGFMFSQRGRCLAENEDRVLLQPSDLDPLGGGRTLTGNARRRTAFGQTGQAFVEAFGFDMPGSKAAGGSWRIPGLPEITAISTSRLRRARFRLKLHQSLRKVGVDLFV